MCVPNAPNRNAGLILVLLRKAPLQLQLLLVQLLLVACVVWQHLATYNGTRVDMGCIVAALLASNRWLQPLLILMNVCCGLCTKLYV
jgi:hypothetical protein